MPGPGAAGLRIFHDHLRMVVIYLAVKNPLGGIDDGFAAREHAVDGVTRLIPKGKADNLAAAVVPSEGMVVKGLIMLRGTPKRVDFPRIEHLADECVTFFTVFSESIWRDGAAGHKRSSYFGVSHRVHARTRMACDKVGVKPRRSHIETPRIDASSSSTMWRTGSFRPARGRADWSCSRQPGLPDTTMSASSAATWLAFRSPSCVAASGCTRL